MSVDHYENFPVASILLPNWLRRPIAAIYRFARGADDIADEGDASNEERLQELAAYNSELDRIEQGQSPADPAFSELACVIAEWRLPLQLFRDLLDAFAQDVVKKRYTNFPELLDYCRRSANPVGRLLLHLVDRASDENLRRSDCICSTLQLINFWQDIDIDWQKIACTCRKPISPASASASNRSPSGAGAPSGLRCLTFRPTVRVP